MDWRSAGLIMAAGLFFALPAPAAEASGRRMRAPATGYLSGSADWMVIDGAQELAEEVFRRKNEAMLSDPGTESDGADAASDLNLSQGLIWDFEGGGDGISAIGDSIMLGAADALRAEIPGITVDAKVSRQVTAAQGIVEEMEASGTLGDTVIIALGTNGTFAYSTGQSLLDCIGDRKVYWVLTGGTWWAGSVNSMIAELSGNNANVTLLDWPSAEAAHPEWTGADGIHLTGAGAQGYADFIAQGISG